MLQHILKFIAASAFCVSIAPCQETLFPESPSPRSESKRILGIIPNYKTVPTLSESIPLRVSEKFRLASEDAFDRGTFGLAAVLAGTSQLRNSNRSFGQGAAGYGRYLGTAYGDIAIGDYMTEAVFPSLFHQDPRYFRQASGTGWKRFRYAIGQTFITHGDSGSTQVNYSRLMGNAAGIAISNAWYADNRTASNAASKFGMQIAVHMTSNILKEFWPDVHRKLSRKHGDMAASLHSPAAAVEPD